MNTSGHIPTMYESIPAVAELNRVPGFEPFKLLRRIVSPEEGKVALQLDLRFKKLWFRLAHPKGRIRLNPLRITEQMAIFEAQVYLERGDENPVGSFTSCCTKEEAPGGQYVQAAQFEAMDEALTDAGFGVQFADVSMDAAGSRYGSRILLSENNAAGNAVTVSPGADLAERAEADWNAGHNGSAGKSSSEMAARNTETVHGKENITQSQKAGEDIPAGLLGQTAKIAQAVEAVEKANPVSATNVISNNNRKESALTAAVGNSPVGVRDTASAEIIIAKPTETDSAPAMAAHESLPVQAIVPKAAAQQSAEMQGQKTQAVGTARAFRPVPVQRQSAQPVVGTNIIPTVAAKEQTAQSAVKANNSQSVMVSGKGATPAGEKKAVQAGSAGVGRTVAQKSASQTAGNGKPLQSALGQKQPAVQSAENSLPVQPQTVSSQPVRNKAAEADTLPADGKSSVAGETKNSVQGAMALLGGQNFRTVQTEAAGLPAKSSMSASVAQSARSSMPTPAAQPAGQALSAPGSAAQETAVSRYTPDMPVEEIMKLMTLEEAGKVVVDIGVCKGMTMEEVAERRPPSLKFYLYGGYKGNNNILRAAAQIMLDSLELQKAG